MSVLATIEFDYDWDNESDRIYAVFTLGTLPSGRTVKARFNNYRMDETIEVSGSLPPLTPKTKMRSGNSSKNTI